MSSGTDKFTPDTQVKQNPFLKILASFLFCAVGIFMAYSVFAQYHKLLVPFFILLGIGVIILSIWLQSLYIYRYLLPAFIIIIVFTVYPIAYTIFIAFTNYGTGHLLVKEDARNEILSSKWNVDENEAPLYAEFYVQKEVVEHFEKIWKEEKQKSIVNVKKARERFIEKSKSENSDFDESKVSDDDIPDVVKLKEKWSYDIEPKIINDTLGKLKQDNFKAIVFNKDEIIVDENGLPASNADEEMAADIHTDENEQESMDSTESEETVAPVAYTAVYDQTGKQFVLTEASFDSLDGFVNDMVLITDQVRIHQGNEEDDESSIYDDDEDEFYADEYPISIGDFAGLQENLREKTPLALFDPQLKDYKRFLSSLGNEFMKKQKLFTTINGQIYMLVEQGDGSYAYTTKVYEDNVTGRFVITKDSEKPHYWKEFVVTQPEFKYSVFTLANNVEIESFLQDKMDADGFADKTIIEGSDAIVGKPLAEVNQDDINNIKEQIKKANQVVSQFNKKLPVMKKEFYTEKKKSITEINQRVENQIQDKKNQIKALKNQRKDLSKEPKSYKTFVAMKNCTTQVNTLIKQIRQLNKENNGRLVQLKRIDFPKIKSIHLITENVSNVDLTQPIEPGYMTTVGMANFTKIGTTRNITSPFVRVFIWTVLWSFFSVLTSFVMGLALALVFNGGNLKGKFFYRTLFILPYAIPSFVSVLMWSGFLNDDFGVINLALGLDVPWLNDPTGFMAKVSCVIVNLWLSFPYMMIISLGALQSIDASMYEAADVDGASKLQQFWSITLPLLLTTLGPMLVGSFAFAFNNFAGIYLLTMGRPVMESGVLPGHTDILISYTYKLAFGENQTDYGLASAIGIIVFIIIGSITFFQFKFTGTFKEVDNA